MDKKSKIFFTIFFSLAFIVAAASFFKFYILKDYYIKSEVVCDPAAEKCFVHECDPAVDAECPSNTEKRISYHKFIEKKASALPLCDPNETDCPPLTCQPGEDCRETLCDSAALAEGEQCSDPAEYLKNQTKTEESVRPDENSQPGANSGNQPRDIFKPTE